jgi:FMN-dependent NADH-azoreductase
MSKLLYIQASPRKGRSKSITVADAFLDSYIQANPQDSIEKIELFEADLPDFALEAVTAKYKVMHGDNHSEQDKKIWDEVVSVINTFKSADKYLFAVPMWNFSIPYRLKQYIDILVQPGLTFKVNEEGNYQGLVENKSVFIVYSSGGEYKKGTPSEGFDL